MLALLLFDGLRPTGDGPAAVAVMTFAGALVLVAATAHNLMRDVAC